MPLYVFFRGPNSCPLLVRGAICVFACLLAIRPSPGLTHQVNIVSLGASNVVGRGVSGPEEAFPAILERLLRDKGYDARVVVSAVAGSSSYQVLSSLSQNVPVGTQIAIVAPSAAVDARHEVSPTSHEEYHQAVIDWLEARGIKVIPIDKELHELQFVLPGYHVLGDAKHLNSAGHARLAAELLPLVVTIVGPPDR